MMTHVTTTTDTSGRAVDANAADPARDPLVLDLLQWIGSGPRAYSDVMDAWRTSCPRLTIWEDAVDAGLVIKHRNADGVPLVSETTLGTAALKQSRANQPI